MGDTQQSKDRFITAVYAEVRDFPPVVDGKRTMPHNFASYSVRRETSPQTLEVRNDNRRNKKCLCAE
jgi:hypothetical protein